jgi:hypothetical protein
MTDYLGAAEATVDSRAYSKLVDYCEGSPAYTGPDDPRYFAHVVAFVHSQRQCFLHHMVSEGIAVPRALDLVRQSVELAAPDRDFPAAMSRERMREVANEMNSRRRASVRFLTAGKLHDLVAGWSEDGGWPITLTYSVKTSGVPNWCIAPTRVGPRSRRARLSVRPRPWARWTARPSPPSWTN